MIKCGYLFQNHCEYQLESVVVVVVVVGRRSSSFLVSFPALLILNLKLLSCRSCCLCRRHLPLPASPLLFLPLSFPFFRAVAASRRWWFVGLVWVLFTTVTYI